MLCEKKKGRPWKLNADVQIQVHTLPSQLEVDLHDFTAGFLLHITLLKGRKNYFLLCINLVFYVFIYLFCSYSVSCIFWSVFNNSSVKHKDEVFHSPEPQLSEDGVNHVRGCWTSGKLWWDEGGEGVGGSVLFLFSASGCWYIFIRSCWSSLPPQHIKFSESLHTAIRHILSGN